MTFSQIALLVITGIPLILAAFNRLRMDLAAILMAVILGVLQFLGFGFLGPANTPANSIKAISGFSQPVVITLIALFIITYSLEKSSVMVWVARRISAIGGKNETLIVALLTSVSVILSLFMNNVAAGALVLPGAIRVSQHTGIKPGRLLIPVAYGSLLGGMATYFTTANIIMSDLLLTIQPPQAPLHILDFTPTGGLIAIAGIVFLAFCGKYILPSSEPAHSQGLVPDLPIPQAIHPLKTMLVVGLTLAGIAASIAGAPVYLSMISAAVLLMILHLVPIQEAYTAIEWQVIFLIAGMYAVSLAFVETGLAALLAKVILSAAESTGPLGVCAAVFGLAMLINQVIGGQVTAYVVGPIALSAAISLGINPQAVAVATAIGCSTSFLTPIAHPVNLIMLAPGGYKFSDFFKAGWALTLITFILLLLGLKIFWGL